jgi:hypothetical protein
MTIHGVASIVHQQVNLDVLILELLDEPFRRGWIR